MKILFNLLCSETEDGWTILLHQITTKLPLQSWNHDTSPSRFFNFLPLLDTNASSCYIILVSWLFFLHYTSTWKNFISEESFFSHTACLHITSLLEVLFLLLLFPLVIFFFFCDRAFILPTLNVFARIWFFFSFWDLKSPYLWIFLFS